MPFIIVIGIGLWFYFGTPTVTVANWFWEDSAAPWEKVDAFYYPNNSDLSLYESTTGLASVQECRDYAYKMAAWNNDPSMIRGSYECGVHKTRDFGGIGVYRITAK